MNSVVATRSSGLAAASLGARCCPGTDLKSEQWSPPDCFRTSQPLGICLDAGVSTGV